MTVARREENSMQKFLGVMAGLSVILLSATAQAGPIEVYTVTTTGTPRGYAPLADGTTARWIETDSSSGTPEAIVYQRAADGTVTSLNLSGVAPTATSHSAVALSQNGTYVALDTTEGSRPAGYSVQLTAAGDLGVVGSTKATNLGLNQSLVVSSINNSGEMTGVSNSTAVYFTSTGSVRDLHTPNSSGWGWGISDDGRTAVGEWSTPTLTPQAAAKFALAFVDLAYGALDSSILGVSPNGRYAGGYRDGFATIWDLIAGT
jgi:hypothetical protein